MDRKVALVTGSARRLGRHIALALARAGYDVVINYLHSREAAAATSLAVKRLGVDALVIRADVRKRPQVRRMIQRIVDRFGRIDLLVNNAAIFPGKTDFAKVTDRAWKEVIDTNLNSVFICGQEAAKFMARRKSGRIINIASIGALVAWKHHVPYCTSKAGVVMLTRVMAKALAPYVLVNAIAPGTIIIPGEEAGTHSHPSIDGIPMGKYGKPDDVTDTVLFLADSANYMTGQILSVDGGVSIR